MAEHENFALLCLVNIAFFYASKLKRHVAYRRDKRP